MYGVQLILHVVILINIILLGGVLPLIERKYLSLIQRRVGPKFVGYKGRLQFIADALKMFLKGCLVPSQANKFFFFFWPAFLLNVCMFFWVNAIWGVSLTYMELEYNIAFLAILSIFLNLCIFLTGYYSKNKYALLGSIRTLLMFFAIELLLGIFFLNLIIFTNSFHIHKLIPLQEEIPLLFNYLGALPLVILLIMFEINKSPFDLSEAETELVTGYHTEYGAFFFALFYLAEYFHLFFTSLYMIFFLSGV